MPTNWVVTTPSNQVELDEAQQGQTTFTVTNPTKRVDRVMVDIVVGDGADESWFTIEEPQRRVPASGSVSYLMKTAVPTTAKPGTYNVQARVYSADSAPEEDSVLSNRVVVEIKEKPKPIVVKKKIPWWIFVVAALVVIVVVGVIVIANNSGGTPAPTPTATVTMPDLNKESEAQARTNLTAFGLTVGTVRHKFDATPDQVIYQSVAGGSVVPKGSPVDLVITVAAAAPVPVPVTAPVPVAQVRPQVTPVPTSPVAAPGGSPSPTAPKPSTSPSASASPAAPTGILTWTEPQDFVHHWVVYITQQFCYTNNLARQPCPIQYNQQVTVAQVDQPAYSPLLIVGQQAAWPGGYFVASQGVFQWSVAAVDDFGNIGPASAASPLTVQ